MLTQCFLAITLLSIFYLLPANCLNDIKYLAFEPSTSDGGKNWNGSPPSFQYRMMNAGQAGYGRRKRVGYKPATCTCTCETKVLKSGKQSPGDERSLRNHEEHLADEKPRYDLHENQPFLDDAYSEHNADNLDDLEKHKWESLPDTECYRRSCTSDRDCCKRFNNCDKSARVCTDCWRGSSCQTNVDCCYKYPRCELNPRSGNKDGKCVDD